LYAIDQHHQDRLPLPHMLVKDDQENLYGWKLEMGNLTVQQLREGHGWSPPEDLANKIMLFDATILPGEGLYTTLVDQQNRFVLYKGYPGNWEEEHFHQEQPQQKVKSLQLLADREKRLHLIYLATTKQEERWWILHLRYSNGEWEEPRVIDFGGNGPTNYGFGMIDRYNRVYFIYRLKEENRVPLYYRVFSSPELNWSRPLLVAPEGDNSYPFLAEDDYRNLHLIWCSRRESGYVVMYRHRLRGSWPAGKWLSPMEISSYMKKPAFPFLEISPKEITACWLTPQEKHFNFSFDFGKNWNASQVYRLAQGEKPVKIVSIGDQGLPMPYWKTGKGDPPLPPEIVRNRLFKHPAPANASPEVNQDNTEQDTAEEVAEEVAEEAAEEAAEESTTTLSKGNEKKEDDDDEQETKPAQEDFTAEIEQLHSTTGSIFNEATRLSRSHYHLQQELEQKKSEVKWISYHTHQKAEALKRSLQNKEKELHQMEENFNRTLGSLRKKFQHARNNWYEENEKLRKEIREIKQNYQNIQASVEEKNDKIKRMDAENQKLRKTMQILREENQQLKDRLGKKSSVGNILGKLLQNKPHHNK